MENDIVIFKNRPDRLLLVMESEADINDIIEVIRSKVTNNVDFFRDCSLNLKYRGRKLSVEEEDRIIEIFCTVAGAEVIDIQEEKITSRESKARQKTSSIEANNFIGLKGLIDSARDIINEDCCIHELYEGNTKFYKGNLKSNDNLSYDGNIVLFGDVEQNAELEASGNIIVFGSISGIVKAGYKGDGNSVIVAKGLYAAAISISDIIAEAPENCNKKFGRFGIGRQSKKRQHNFEIAYLKNGEIYVEPFMPNDN